MAITATTLHPANFLTLGKAARSVVADRCAKYLMKLSFFLILICSLIKTNWDKNSLGIHLASNNQKEIIDPVPDILKYLSNNYTKNDSSLIYKPKWMIDTNTKDSICGYNLSYKEGHKFIHEFECNEWGEIVTVYFRNLELNQVKNIVNNLYRTEGYNWYNNIEYRPKVNYERLWTFNLKKEQGFTILEFSYSWI